MVRKLAKDGGISKDIGCPATTVVRSADIVEGPLSGRKYLPVWISYGSWMDDPSKKLAVTQSEGFGWERDGLS